MKPPEEEEPEVRVHRIPPAVYVGWAITVISMLVIGACAWQALKDETDQNKEDIKSLKNTSSWERDALQRIMGKFGIEPPPNQNER